VEGGKEGRGDGVCGVGGVRVRDAGAVSAVRGRQSVAIAGSLEHYTQGFLSVCFCLEEEIKEGVFSHDTFYIPFRSFW
jgi:hypothetical protein